MARTMRAKLVVGSVIPHRNTNGDVQTELVAFYGVSKPEGYAEDGMDEDNTFAKFSPSVHLQIMIANPALFGKLAVGQKYYVDFTRAKE